MLNLERRRMLKILGAAPLVSLPIVASAGSANLSEPLAPDLPPPAVRTSMQLEIQIIDSHSVPDNNVVFRNCSDESLVITRFMPGHIVYADKLMDLNAALGDKALELKAGQSGVLQFDVWSVVNAGPIEYVWADHAVDILNEDTSIITLGAFMADTNAVVYANTNYVTS